VGPCPYYACKARSKSFLLMTADFSWALEVHGDVRKTENRYLFNKKFKNF
jgi:hypothetical protein